MQRPPPYNWLFVFKVTIESGSFTKASENLNVSQSAVSQQVKSLEDYLGQSLIIREKKGLKLTNVGKHYYAIIKASLDDISLATNALFSSQIKGIVSINCNYSFMASWLSKNISEFQARHSDVNFEIYTALWLTDQNKADSHIKISYGPSPANEPNIHKLTEETIFPVCSPELAKKITSVDDILDYPITSIMGNNEDWGVWFELNNQDFRTRQNILYLDSSVAAYEAAASGSHIALGIQTMVEPHLNSGRLVKLPSIDAKIQKGFYIVEPTTNRLSEKEKDFCDWLKSKFA